MYPCRYPRYRTAVWVFRGILRCVKTHYHTRTRSTHFGNTAGISVPVPNPTGEPHINFLLLFIFSIWFMSHCDPTKKLQSHSHTSPFTLHLHHPHFKVSHNSLLLKLIFYIADTNNGWSVYKKEGKYVYKYWLWISRACTGMPVRTTIEITNRRTTRYHHHHHYQQQQQQQQHAAVVLPRHHHH